MGFIMAGLEKDDFDREYSDKALLKRIINYFSPYKKGIALIIFSLLFGSLASTLVPLYISDMLDQIEKTYLTTNGIDPLGTIITTLMIAILFFFIINFIGNWLQQEITARTVASAVVDVRNDVFDAVLERDMAFLNEQPTGKLVSRIQNDTNSFGQTITLTTSLLAQVLVVFFLLFFLFDRSIKLTIVLLLFAPVVVFTALLFRKIARDVSRKSQRVLAKINAMVQESFSGIYVAKAFRAENTIYNEFLDLNTTSYRVNLRMGIVFNSIFPILAIISAIATAFLIYLGGLDVIGNTTDSIGALLAWLPGGRISFGDWFLFFQGIFLFFFPLISIASFWSQFQQGLAASERVFSLIDAENTVVQYDRQLLENPKGKIEFRDLTFAYKEGKNILKKFHLTINAGEKVAIVGHTGAGKSTLVKLISRNYEYQSGQLLIDDQDIRSLDLNEYRKKLAIISQEVFMWNSSIKENLLYGSGHITDAEMKMNNVLDKLGIMDWINRLPEGLDTNVGERGNRLSMGQRQLIAFARILLVNPMILIMDEATSSVDPLTEVMIQKTINLLLEGRTSIVVAHRLSTVKNVDRIIVIKEGKIIEQGSHDELMKDNGHYAELYNTYFRHQSLAYIEEQAKDN
ncbi:MAG: putative multidrug resistance ABC transporter ATP-binding/permease protein YheH [Candidatus Heimdallarchaeota archaeon LC_3]|nr:MAG: putative multidrug resistance ABC transporter ATP-binding/permease protein YheH [Candidatus Heimdallarchaeota archaeon LC_3]